MRITWQPNYTAISAGESLNWDILRISLLLQVVCGHLGSMLFASLPDMITVAGVTYIGVPFRLFTRFGRESAFLFVFISGYFVGGSLFYYHLQGIPVLLRDILPKRIFRIMPTLALALIVTAIVDWMGIVALGHRSSYLKSQFYDIVSHETAWHLVGNVLCLQPTLVDTFGSNGPLWTLGYIMQFSLVGIALLKSGRNAMVHKGIGLVLVLAILLIDQLWVILLIGWFAGAASRNIMMRPPPLIISSMAFIILLLVANVSSPLVSAALSSLSGLAATLMARSVVVNPPNIATRAIRHFANLSYPVYAVHFPVSFLLWATLLGGITWSTRDAIAFLIIATGVVYAISLCTKWLADTLCMSWQQRGLQNTL